MLFGQNRDQLRRFYCAVWAKQQTAQPLEPLERLVAEVIQQHPEYQYLLDDAEQALSQEYLPESGQINPFLHMGMHIAIQEQLAADKPLGIRHIYQQLCQQFGQAHRAEHQMMEALGETLWEAQRNGIAPNEQQYLHRLQTLS